jgi:hypothetical protein
MRAILHFSNDSCGNPFVNWSPSWDVLSMDLSVISKVNNFAPKPMERNTNVLCLRQKLGHLGELEAGLIIFVSGGLWKPVTFGYFCILEGLEMRGALGCIILIQKHVFLIVFENFTNGYQVWHGLRKCNVLRLHS